MKLNSLKIKPFFYKLSVSLIIASSLSFTIGSIAFISSKELLENNENVIYSYNKINLLSGIIGDLKDIETGQRGYVITGKPKFLEPYYTSLTTIDEKINMYSSLIKEEKEKEKFKKIIFLKDEKLKELEVVINLRKEISFQAAVDEVSTEKGRKIMDKLRILIDNLNNSEIEKLVLIKEQSANLVIVTRLSILSTALVNLLILAIAYQLVQEEIKRREVVENKLTRANRALSFSLQDVSTEIDTYLTSGIERKIELQKLNDTLKSFNLHE